MSSPRSQPAPPPCPGAGTRITSAGECQRKAWLEERVAEPGGGNDKAVKGTLTHALIQAALTQGLRSAPQLHAAAERVVADSTEALYQAGGGWAVGWGWDAMQGSIWRGAGCTQTAAFCGGHAAAGGGWRAGA